MKNKKRRHPESHCAIKKIVSEKLSRGPPVGFPRRQREKKKGGVDKSSTMQKETGFARGMRVENQIQCTSRGQKKKRRQSAERQGGKAKQGTKKGRTAAFVNSKGTRERSWKDKKTKRVHSHKHGNGRRGELRRGEWRIYIHRPLRKGIWETKETQDTGSKPNKSRKTTNKSMRKEIGRKGDGGVNSCPENLKD